ncbi:MAG: TylF/MycF/NovP-related O-methyltransferase [Candidatus Binatia bacterium]
MGTMKHLLQRMLGNDQGAAPALWPRTRKKPRVLYEIDQKFHLAYDRALDISQMRDVAMRRQRYYTFRYLLHGVALVPGDVCEVGCYRGLSARLIASTLSEMDKKAPFHLCDSFEGLSEFSAVDRSDFHDMDQPEKRRKYVCSLERVQQNLREFDFIVYHKGWIPEPFQPLVDSRFCFVHIDVDLYQPTRDSFEFFYPRLSPNGVMVFDDYGSVKFPGARQAIDECLGRVHDAFFVVLPAGQAFLIKLLQTGARVL